MTTVLAFRPSRMSAPHLRPLTHLRPHTGPMADPEPPPTRLHGTKVTRSVAGRDGTGRLVYRWSASCRCGDTLFGEPGGRKADMRPWLNGHIRDVVHGVDVSSPAYVAVANATRLRILLETARHGLTAALLDPDPGALFPRVSEVADLLNDAVNDPVLGDERKAAG